MSGEYDAGEADSMRRGGMSDDQIRSEFANRELRAQHEGRAGSAEAWSVPSGRTLWMGIGLAVLLLIMWNVHLRPWQVVVVLALTAAWITLRVKVFGHTGVLGNLVRVALVVGLLLFSRIQAPSGDVDDGERASLDAAALAGTVDWEGTYECDDGDRDVLFRIELLPRREGQRGVPLTIDISYLDDGGGALAEGTLVRNRLAFEVTERQGPRQPFDIQSGQGRVRNGGDGPDRLTGTVQSAACTGFDLTQSP